MPEPALEALAEAPRCPPSGSTGRVHGTLERTGAAIGATWVRENLGVDGAGVGVAIIDSGVTRGTTTSAATASSTSPTSSTSSRCRTTSYGHGTHVAGIIAGSGYDSNGARRGIAPGAHLVVLKVLDGDGDGYISNVIAALDYAVEHRARSTTSASSICRWRPACTSPTRPTR